MKKESLHNIGCDFGEVLALSMAIELMCRDISAGCCDDGLFTKDLRKSFFDVRSKLRAVMDSAGIHITNTGITAKKKNA